MTPSELLQAFAEKNRLTAKLDADRTYIIPGKRGHLYAFSDTRMAATAYGPETSPKKWGRLRREGLDIGLVLVQDGDEEGTMTFDPGNRAQVRLVLKLLGVKRRRTCSPAQLEVLKRARGLLPGVAGNPSRAGSTT